ncbi:hypothetical protein [Kitasatospora sp. MBT63]|uniref:hypothetical protein n=1 Tax=Kitasatospora sp. MBT63 TaxID=1444768 RepID=UPI00053B89D7|nr:hypothetical protein [Kitasatospora sp. MBT63]
MIIDNLQDHHASYRKVADHGRLGGALPRLVDRPLCRARILCRRSAVLGGREGEVLMIDRARVLARLQEAERAGRQAIAADEAARALCHIAVVAQDAIEVAVAPASAPAAAC